MQKNNLCKMLLTDLNDKVLLEIFSYLDLSDCVNLADTCLHLRELADVKYEQFTSFSLVRYWERLEEDGSMADVKKVLSHIGPHISTLFAELKQHKYGFDLSEPIKKYCVNVKTLKLFQMYEPAFALWIQDLKLESLTLQCTRNSIINLDGITTLKELKMEDLHDFRDETIVTELYNVLERNPNIESLEIPLTRQFNYAVFAKLKLLYLGVYVEDSKNLGKLLVHLDINELTKFQIVDWYRDNRYVDELNGFLKILSKSPKLKKLSIKMFTNLIDESTLRTLVSFKLTSLQVSYPSYRHSRFETIITQVQPNLTRLCLGRRCQSLDRTIFLIKSLMKLEMLHFYTKEANKLLHQETIKDILQSSNDRPTLVLHARDCNREYYSITLQLFFKKRQHRIMERCALTDYFDKMLLPCCNSF